VLFFDQIILRKERKEEQEIIKICHVSNGSWKQAQKEGTAKLMTLQK